MESGPLRSFESALRDTQIPAISRVKAEPWHPTELLFYSFSPSKKGIEYHYIIVGVGTWRFDTVEEAMAFIEEYWEEERRQVGLKAERKKKVHIESPLFVNDEWEVTY
jgi:hypothetical protein